MNNKVNRKAGESALGQILFSLVILLALMVSGSVSAYYDRDEPHLYVEKVGDGSYASGRDGIQSFASTQDIVLTTGGNNIDDDVSVHVYDADMDDVLEYLIYEGEGEQINTDISIDNKELIATMDVDLEDEFTLPADGNGVWLLRVEADEVEVFVYVIRSRYGTVIKEEQNGLLAWVQDFDTKRSLSDVPITVYSLRDEIKQRTQTKTDNDGIAHMNTSAEYDVMIVGDNGNEALVPLNLEYLNIDYKSDDNKYQGQKERMRNFIFTDRPLYKPGDTVYFKVISRADDDLVYRVAQGKWKVQLVTGWGDSIEVIAEGYYDIDSYGAIAGEMQLPEDTKTGQYYRLEISSEKYEDDSFYGWFASRNYAIDIQVEHYRKPQYELSIQLDEHEYINGENISFEVNGKYFSGESLANAQIEYTVNSNNFWESSYESDYVIDTKSYRYGFGYGTEVMKSSVTLDANGQAHVSVPTSITDGKSKVYTISVEYAADTDEPVIDGESALVYAGEYGIYRTESQHSFSVNKEVVMGLVLHENEDGVNIANQKLEVSGKRIWYEVRDRDARYRQYDRRESPIAPASVTTDGAGKADFRFMPHESGSYELSAQATDERDNIIKKDFHIWVSDHEMFVPEQGRGLAVVLDKAEYEPGDTVNVAIASNMEDRDVLMDVERDFVHRFEVLHIDGNTKNISINLEDADVPNMRVSVNSFASDRLDNAQQEIEISSKTKKLDINIVTDKSVYAPGDIVTVDVTAKDSSGNPQKADIALWAVDKALFELTPQGNHDIHGTYWDYRPGRTSESNSLRGIWINMAEMGGGGNEGLRTLFKDVAYWNPRVRTGDDGKAQINFELPDDLTTWVISAVGATKDTIVGNTTHEIRTTKAAIIRPQLPNILRNGDESVVVASAHNNTDKNRTFIAKLKLSRGTVDEAQQEVTILSGESRVVAWHIHPEYTDEPIGFTYTLTAKDDEKVNDGVYKEVPIEQFGFLQTDSVAHAGIDPYNVKINSDARNDKTSVELTVASTVMSSLTGAMNYLIHYPYGCMEQTTSAFMPAVLAKENPAFFSESLEGKDIDDIITKGIERLNDKQSSDGGWSWWGGNSDVFLSVYVAEYLFRAQAQGASVDDAVIAKAREYFNQHKVSNEFEQVMVMYGKSLFSDNGHQQEIIVTDILDADIVAMAVIANVRNGYTDKNTNGYNVLVSKLQDHGNISYWPAGAKERFGSIDASSGIGLRAFLVADGDTQIASRVMQHFLSSRQKEYWTSTFATAQVLEGFVTYGERERQGSQNYNAQIFVDDTLLTTKIFNSNNTVEIVKIPLDMIKEAGSIVSIKPNDQSAVLYSTLLTREYRTSTEAEPISRTISIERTYTNENGKNYSIGIGDTVIVDFAVSGLKKGDRYFMIDDQLPAGMVPLNEHLDNVIRDNTNNLQHNYVGKEYTKNGAILTDGHVHDDGTQYYRYKARVVSGGDYNVPPVQASLMYMPEVYTHSGSITMHIETESQVVSIDGSKIQESEKNNIFDNISFQAIAISIIGLITLGAFGVIWAHHKKS